jgi:DNA replication protein DnaC
MDSFNKIATGLMAKADNFKHPTGIGTNESLKHDFYMAGIREKAYSTLSPGLIYQGLWTESERLDESQQAMIFLRQLQHTNPVFTVFLGSVGGGKTCACVVGAIDAMAEHFKREFTWSKGLEKVYDGVFATHSDLQNALGYSAQKEKSRLMKTRVLVMDDLMGIHEGGVTPAFITLIREIVDYRYRFRLTTFINSNLTKEQFQETYGERVVSRIGESKGLCLLKNEDLRKNKNYGYRPTCESDK